MAINTSFLLIISCSKSGVTCDKLYFLILSLFSEIILENISEEYECIFDDSNGTTSIIKTTENANIENIKSISDKMVVCQDYVVNI